MSLRVPRVKLMVASVLAVFAVLAGAASASAAGLFSQMPGEMLEARFAPAAAVLPDGKVLIAGGVPNGLGFLSTAEAYDPTTGTFEKLSEMKAARAETVTVALPDGHVLIAGGRDATPALKTAELFDPAARTFEALGAEMTLARDYAGGVLLPSGKVFITGGEQGTAPPYTKTAELYDPATRTFSAVKGAAVEGRYGPVVALLPNGKVLIAGGEDGEKYLTTAELYDPASETFQKLEGAAHEVAEPRAEAAGVTLQNGRVLIAGGYVGKALATAEVFDPATNAFTKLPDLLTSAREGDSAVLLPDGRALFIGGYDESLPEAVRRRKTIDAAAVATTPTTGAASALGITTADLTGTALTDAQARVLFQYGPTTAYGSATGRQAIGFAPSPQAIGASLTGLAPATTYHFRIVAENASGTSYGADRTFTTLPPVPALASVKQSRSRWRLGSGLAQVSRKRRVPVGTSFSFTLNTPANVTLAFTQKASGRRVHGRCVAPTPRNRRARHCSRTVTRGTLVVNGHAGVNTVRFQGRISRSKKLRPGTYTLVISATGPSGAAKPQRLTFTIVR